MKSFSSTKLQNMSESCDEEQKVDSSNSEDSDSELQSNTEDTEEFKYETFVD